MGLLQYSERGHHWTAYYQQLPPLLTLGKLHLESDIILGIEVGGTTKIIHESGLQIQLNTVPALLGA